MVMIFDTSADLYFVSRLANYIGIDRLIFQREKKIFLFKGGKLRTVDESELENIAEMIV